MESRVIFQDGMDADPADHNTLQSYVEASADNIVADAIIAARGFAGFAAAKTGVTQVTVDPGRLYDGGRRFAKNLDTVFEFATQLPVATLKYATIVVWGQTVDTSASPREFLIDEETGATEPRVVALERARVANVQVVFAASENANPVPPILDANLLGVANVLLSTTGVVSVEMIGDNEVPNLDEVDLRVRAAEAFVAAAEPRFASLASDIAALANGQKQTVRTDVFERMLGRVALLEAKSGIPQNAVDSAADFFLSLDHSDPAFSGFSAKTEEGIRLPPAAANEQAIALFNPLDPAAKIANTIMLPAYDRTLRLSVGPRTGEVGISTYTYQTFTMVQKTMSRIRIRYGTEFSVCTNSAFWRTGAYDPVSQTFTRAGETFQVLNPQDTGRHTAIRLRQFWYDAYEEPYWDRITVDHTVSGSQIAETFPVGQDLWLDAVGLFFTQVAASGTVHVALCEATQYGIPDLDNVVAVATVNQSDLKLYPTETIVPIGPVFLSAAKRYAIVITTGANHYVATTAGENFPSGTFFTVIDGAYAQGDGTRDLCFKLYTCKFRSSRAVIQINPMSLSGGIADIDINTDAIVPKSCSLTFEIQISGVWYPLDGVDETVLGAGGYIPPLLPMRAVFVGAPEIMPGIKLLNSVVKYSRPATTFRHISSIRTLPSSSTAIRVTAHLEYFVEANHDLDCKILTGAGYATVNNAASYTDVTNEDGSIDRTFVFTLGAGVTTYRIDFRGTVTSALDIFHIAWRKDWAL